MYHVIIKFYDTALSKIYNRYENKVLLVDQNIVQDIYLSCSL